MPENATAANLGTILDQTLGELLAGRLDPRVATAVAQLVNTRRRVTETVHLEARIAELERKLAEQASAAAEQARAADGKSDLPLGWIRPEDGQQERGDGTRGRRQGIAARELKYSHV